MAPGGRVTITYRKRYGVDHNTAYDDLTALGVPLLASAEQWAERPPVAPRPRMGSAEVDLADEDIWIDMDGRAMFVVGYTPGGAPYGSYLDTPRPGRIAISSRAQLPRDLVKGARIGDAGGPLSRPRGEPMALWLSTFVVYFLAAVLLRRWLMLVIPVIVIPLLYYGLHVGWWGSGFGSNGNWWEYAAFLAAAVVVVTTVLIGVAKLAARKPHGTRVANVLAVIAAAGAIAIIVGVVD